jgi:hypothetical protein
LNSAAAMRKFPPVGEGGFAGGGTMRKSEVAEAVAGAYYIMQLLPLAPDHAEAILAMVEDALTHPDSHPEEWTGPAGYVFSHLRKSKPEMAAATLAVARDIIRAIRPHFE